MTRRWPRAGDSVWFQYDVLGRTTWIAYPQRRWSIFTHPGYYYTPGDTVHLVYDTLGAVDSSWNRTGKIVRRYYANGQVRLEEWVPNWTPTGGGVWRDSLQYAYDVNGLRTRMIHNRDTVLYTYPDGRLDKMRVFLASKPADPWREFTFSWDALGRRDTIIYPWDAAVSGVPMRVTFAYDAAGSLRRLHSTQNKASTLFGFSVANTEVDALGRVLKQTAACPGGSSLAGDVCETYALTTWRYNLYGWLVRQTGMAQDTMAYDPSGNIVYRQQGSTRRRFTMATTTNRIVSELDTAASTVTTITFVYDANGARTNETVPGSTVAQYWYDTMGRTSGTWTSYEDGSVQDVDSCRYDALGRLITACRNGPWAAFDGQNVVGTVWPGVSDCTNQPCWRYVHGPNLDDPLLGTFKAAGASAVTTVNYFVTDGAGRQYMVAGADGLPLQADAQSVLAGGTLKAQSFDAQRWNGATAPRFSYFRNRVYDQATGRWTQEDPIGIAGGTNLYQFNGNNPVMFTDPFGLKEDTLRYNGKKATLVGDDGKVKWSGPAYSGKPGTTAADQGKRNTGPIPEGTYTIDPTKVSHVTGLHAIARNMLADWGNYRVPLEPSPGTDTKGRDGFKLHGGDTPGSAGCIDVCHGEATLFPLIQAHDGPITVVVDYP